MEIFIDIFPHRLNIRSGTSQVSNLGYCWDYSLRIGLTPTLPLCDAMNPDNTINFIILGSYFIKVDQQSYDKCLSCLPIKLS